MIALALVLCAVTPVKVAAPGITSAGGDDSILVRMNPGGVVSWAQNLGGVANEDSQGSMVLIEDQLLVAGYCGPAAPSTTLCPSANTAWVISIAP